MRKRANVASDLFSACGHCFFCFCSFFLHPVAEALNTAGNRALVNGVGVILNPHLARGEVDHGLQHAVQLAYAALQLQSAIGAIHAFDGQLAMAIALLHADAGLARLLLHRGHRYQRRVVMQAELGRLTAVVVEMGFRRRRRR